MIKTIKEKTTVGERHHELEMEALEEKLLGKTLAEIEDHGKFGLVFVFNDGSKFEIRQGFLKK